MPSLQTIYKDALLFNALTKFMRSQYNEENILFLRDVKKINNHKNDDIENRIISIYNRYIKRGAEYQLNLSYGCFMDILSKKSQLIDYDLNQKCQIFDLCVNEIERLISISILPSFYNSSLFINVICKKVEALKM